MTNYELSLLEYSFEALHDTLPHEGAYAQCTTGRCPERRDLAKKLRDEFNTMYYANEVK